MRTKIDYRKIYTEHWQVEIPAGFHIHHIDGDNHNNNPINLVALSAQDHHDAHLAMGDVWSAKKCLWINKATKAAHTPEANAKRAAKMIGRTKENHEGVAVAAAKMTGKGNPNFGKTKYNDKGRAAQAAKMTGRTKETCPGVAAAAAKMTGRTKETCPGVAAMAAKLSAKMSGRNHPSYDPTIYWFQNVETGQFRCCDRHHMKEEFGVGVKKLFHTKPQKTAYGWKLLGTRSV